MDTTEQFVVPVPLALHWVNGDWRPLWLATELRAIEPQKNGVSYIHSRYPTHRAELAQRQGVLTSAGQHKDVRIPLRTALSKNLEGWCLGIETEVRRLLSTITHVGRKPAHGHGRVLEWSVKAAGEPLDADWILDRRMTPIAALGSMPVPADRIAPRGGWTPPYWDARLHAACRRPAWTE